MAMASLPNQQEAEIVTSSHVVDVKSVNMLDSESWNEILDVLSSTYLSVNPNRPKWLEQREELSHLALSLSTTPLTQIEMVEVATQISKDHGINEECKQWAKNEAKWLLRTLNEAKTLMDAFMKFPTTLSNSPGLPAPNGHPMMGMPMRTSMIHTAFIILASHRRVEHIVDMVNLAQNETSAEVTEEATSSSGAPMK